MSQSPSAQNQPCWISQAGSKILRQCKLFDVSDKGATISSHSTLPDTFDLFLALDDKVGYSCRVTSRSGHEVAVEFLVAEASTALRLRNT